METLVKFVIELLKKKIEYSNDENIELEFINGVEYEGQYKYDEIRELLLDHQFEAVKKIDDLNFNGLSNNLLIFIAKIGDKLKYIVTVIDPFDIDYMPEIIDIIAIES